MCITTAFLCWTNNSHSNVELITFRYTYIETDSTDIVTDGISHCQSQYFFSLKRKLLFLRRKSHFVISKECEIREKIFFGRADGFVRILIFYFHFCVNSIKKPEILPILYSIDVVLIYTYLWLRHGL